MTNIDKELISLLVKGETIKKIKERTQMCSSDIAVKFNELESKGYLISRLFYEYGVKFQLSNKTLSSLQNNIEFPINSSFTFLVLSDTHYGNIYECPKLIKKSYQYAESKDIRYVFHLGDLTEGPELETRVNERLKRLDVHDQIDYVTRNYPKFDKVNTLYILGNHDARGLNNGIDISKVITKRRLDMHFLGYEYSKLKIGNINILLHHPFSIEKNSKYDNEIKDIYFNQDFDLILRGHTHSNEVYTNDTNSVVVNVPACYVSPSREFTSIYEVTIKNNNNEVELVNLFLSNNTEELIPISKVHYPLRGKQLVKQPQDQIAKFNNKWNKKR